MNLLKKLKLKVSVLSDGSLKSQIQSKIKLKGVLPINIVDKGLPEGESPMAILATTILTTNILKQSESFEK